MTFNTEEAIDTAMDQYKGGIRDWFTAWTSETNITVEATLDYDLLNDKLREWELAAITNPAFEGAIEIVDDVAVIEPPADGQMIERAVSTNLIEAALISGSIDVIGLPTSTSTPAHTLAQLEAYEGLL